MEILKAINSKWDLNTTELPKLEYAAYNIQSTKFKKNSGGVIQPSDWIICQVDPENNLCTLYACCYKEGYSCDMSNKLISSLTNVSSKHKKLRADQVH